jgi:hypothetical protein
MAAKTRWPAIQKPDKKTVRFMTIRKPAKIICQNLLVELNIISNKNNSRDPNTGNVYYKIRLFASHNRTVGCVHKSKWCLFLQKPERKLNEALKVGLVYKKNLRAA